MVAPNPFLEVEKPAPVKRKPAPPPKKKHKVKVLRKKASVK
jgi:hypothetical protein